MRLYRWLLGLCAATLGREYGAAMEETLARRLSAARRAGRWRMAKVWCRELASLLWLAVAERWGASARARRRQRTLEASRKAGTISVSRARAHPGGNRALSN